MRALAALLIASVALALTTAAASAEDPVVLDMRIDGPETITVGDRLTYVVTLEADKGIEFSVVQSTLPREVEIIGTPRTSTRSAADGRIEVTLTFQLAVFVPGNVEVPPISLRYFGQDVAGGTVTTPASRLAIVSVLPAGGQLEPRDLKPQAEIGVSSPAWVGPALAVAVAALVLILALMSWRIRTAQRRAAFVPAPVIVADGPEDRARIVLDRAGVDFGADGDYIAYYGAIAVTVRTYLTQRYGFPAFALTTRELEKEMLRRGLDRWQVRVAGGLLTQCDSVVYANYRPAAERADADLTAAYEIVEMSRPAEREAVGAAT